MSQPFNARAIHRLKSDRLYRVYVDAGFLTFVRIGGQASGIAMALDQQLGPLGKRLAERIRRREQERTREAVMAADAVGPGLAAQQDRHSFQIPVIAVAASVLRAPRAYLHGPALGIWTLTHSTSAPGRFQLETEEDLATALDSLPEVLGDRLVLEPLTVPGAAPAPDPVDEGDRGSRRRVLVALAYAAALLVVGLMSGLGGTPLFGPRPAPDVPAEYLPQDEHDEASGERPGPSPLVRVEPDYPKAARKAGIQGWVLLEYTVSSEGTVQAPRVVDAAPEGVFEDAALAAIVGWSYEPERRGDVPVDSPGVRLLMRFQLDDSERSLERTLERTTERVTERARELWDELDARRRSREEP